MEQILEYIVLNYTWFLGVAIVILLAIIGYYAEKTNFAQGKEKEVENNNRVLPEQIIEEEKIEQPVEEIVVQEKETQNEQTVEEKTSDSDLTPKKSLDETFAEYDSEINYLLPKKNIIDDELLDEIENLSVDKSSSKDLTEILDLSNLELPKIKNIVDKETDVWKF